MDSHLGRPKTNCCFVLGCIGMPRFHLLLRHPKREETFLCQIFLACGYTSPPYPASALHSAFGAPKGQNVSFRQGSCKEWEWDFLMKSSYPVIQRMSFWVLLNQGFHRWDATVVAIQPQVIIFEHSHSSFKIPSSKFNTACRRPVNLTGHFVAGNENGCTESSKFFWHKYYKIDQWCNGESKVVTSLVRLGCKT